MNERSLEKKEEYSLIADWQNNKNEKSLNRLIGAYYKLIKAVAKKFSSYGLSQSDLIQEGTIGFMHALEKFDLLKGFRLSTYSHWWIRAAIQSYILKKKFYALAIIHIHYTWVILSMQCLKASHELWESLALTCINRTYLGKYEGSGQRGLDLKGPKP